MEEWKEYKLRDLYDVHNGLSKGGKFFGSGYPFLSFKTVFNNYFLPPVLPDLVQSDEKEQGGYDIKRGDVFVTRTSETPEELGMSSVALKDYPFATYNGFTKRLRPKDTSIIYPEFIGYYLRSTKFRALFYGLASSMSTRASLANGDLLGMKVFIPTFATQEKIAKILKSLDDKIEVNRKINENLEQQAQALFKYWFVDFEPFKDGEFVESELGMIPKGWRVVSFKNVCKNITDGVHNTVKDDLNGNYYLLSCKNIKGGYVSIGKDERRIDLITFEKLRKRTKLQKGDILLSSVGTIGEMVLLNEEPINYEFQRSVAIIKPNTEMISSEFLYYTMKNQKDVIIHSAHGAVQQCLFISDVANFITIYPPYEIIQRFTTIVRGLHNIITNNRQESRRLATLRDTLLPKLMSGELKVNEVEI